MTPGRNRRWSGRKQLSRSHIWEYIAGAAGRRPVTSLRPGARSTPPATGSAAAVHLLHLLLFLLLLLLRRPRRRPVGRRMRSPGRQVKVQLWRPRPRAAPGDALRRLGARWQLGGSGKATAYGREVRRCDAMRVEGEFLRRDEEERVRVSWVQSPSLLHMTTFETTSPAREFTWTILSE